jgi:hypothetical protein
VGEDLNEPYVERRTDVRTRQRIVDLEERYRKVARGVTCAVAIIGVTLFVVAVVLAALIHANKQRALDIQNDRARSIRENCEATNDRHDKSSESLIASAKVDEDNAATEIDKAEIRRRRDVTLALLDALTPENNCDAIVRRSVQKVFK